MGPVSGLTYNRGVQLSIDHRKVDRCRTLARDIADEVQRFIDRHTTTGAERTVARAYGVRGTDANGTPLVNLLVDRVHQAGYLGHGIAFFLGRELLRGAESVQDAAERLAFSSEPLTLGGNETPEAIAGVLRGPTAKALTILDDATTFRCNRQQAYGSQTQDAPLKYVIVATGNIHDDATQARSAAWSGADIIAVIRATAQSLLDYVPEGATTEGFGGTFATQENFRIIRRALDESSDELGRYVMQTNYSSGLCMSEIAYLAAVERLDMLLNDSMYGILFRDINMKRTLIDQYVSRRIIARAKIIINTGEDNYLTTADAVDAAHTVLGSQFINEAFAHKAGVSNAQLGLGHAYEINPWLENSFLLELAQAQLVRQIFHEHPIKWMPPTKFKTGDIFHSHVHDAMFNLVGVLTHQSIELLGMFSEAIHNPLLMDRYLSLKSARYVFSAARDLGDEIQLKPDGKIEQRARLVLDDALRLLEQVRDETLWTAIERGAFADVKRSPTGGKGLAGVTPRDQDYCNPLLQELER